jgi:hypothetical protein
MSRLPWIFARSLSQLGSSIAEPLSTRFRPTEGKSHVSTRSNSMTATRDFSLFLLVDHDETRIRPRKLIIRRERLFSRIRLLAVPRDLDDHIGIGSFGPILMTRSLDRRNLLNHQDMDEVRVRLPTNLSCNRGASLELTSCLLAVCFAVFELSISNL